MGTDFIRWTSQISTTQSFTILPDGCQDIILRNGRATLTSLDLQPREITQHPGDSLTGLRLRPGLHIDADQLPDIKTEQDAAGLIAQAEHSEISQAIQTLGSDNTRVRDTAKHLGVSLRTLQRHLRQLNLPPPEFWRLLGRARRAAIALGSDLAIAEIAGSHGYSDQSHLARACQYWFRATPRHIQKTANLRTDINQPALGTWTLGGQ